MIPATVQMYFNYKSRVSVLSVVCGMTCYNPCFATAPFCKPVHDSNSIVILLDGVFTNLIDNTSS